MLNNSATLRLGNNGTTGVVNLNGGVVNVAGVARGSGQAILNFNGGTLRANANVPAFISGLTSVLVYAGGAMIENGGNNANIDSLQAPTGNGVTLGTLAVSGSGFAAPPIIEVNGGGGIGATAVANIDASGTLTGVTLTSAGSGYTSIPTFNFVGGGGTVSKTGAAQLASNIGGGVTFAGSGITNLTGTNTYTGSTTVAAGTLIVTGSALLDEGSVIVNSGATLAVSGDERVGLLTGTGNVTVGGVHSFRSAATQGRTMRSQAACSCPPTAT